METCSTKMWMSSSTPGTGISSRGGCCCRREFRARLSGGRVTSRFESWVAEARFRLAVQSRLARGGYHSVPSFTSRASACSGGRRSGPFAAAFEVRSPLHGSVAIVPLRFHSSVRALAVSHRSGRSTSCRTRHERLILMERLDLSDFDVRPNIESRQRLLAVPFEAWPLGRLCHTLFVRRLRHAPNRRTTPAAHSRREVAAACLPGGHRRGREAFRLSVAEFAARALRHSRRR